MGQVDSLFFISSRTSARDALGQGKTAFSSRGNRTRAVPGLHGSAALCISGFLLVHQGLLAVERLATLAVPTNTSKCTTPPLVFAETADLHGRSLTEPTLMRPKPIAGTVSIPLGAQDEQPSRTNFRVTALSADKNNICET